MVVVESKLRNHLKVHKAREVNPSGITDLIFCIILFGCLAYWYYSYREFKNIPTEIDEGVSDGLCLVPSESLSKAEMTWAYLGKIIQERDKILKSYR